MVILLKIIGIAIIFYYIFWFVGLAIFAFGIGEKQTEKEAWFLLALSAVLAAGIYGIIIW